MTKTEVLALAAVGANRLRESENKKGIFSAAAVEKNGRQQARGNQLCADSFG
jgi:hypothetical protein